MIKLLYVDLFCGAGGTSTGVEKARHKREQCAKVIGCVNHDTNAIASHAANHPDALHFTEDIRTLELSPLVEHVARMRKQYPDALIVLWASLECTNFSKAKGGQPRDADSRTLAEHLFRYIEAIKPDYVQIENVEEFMSWGDLDKNGKPISKDAGRLYQKWITTVRNYGYKFEHRILNSADYGAYTSRKRFFGTFARPELPIAWPKPTHAKNPQKNLFGASLQKWNAVKDVLDFTDEGESIFVRKKQLADKTLWRIYAGLVKFVAGGKDKFLIKYNSMAQNGRYNPPGVDTPCPVVSCQNRLGVCNVHFLTKYYTGDPNNMVAGVDAPAPTITANRKWNYLMNPQFASAGGSVDNPCFTLIARMDKMPPYLVVTETGEVIIEVYDTNSEPMRKIKEFMALYGIVDIKMRMLRIPELKQIMGFPKDYELIGSQADQKKFIGNAVEVNMARVLCEALCEKLIELNINPLRITS